MQWLRSLSFRYQPRRAWLLYVLLVLACLLVTALPAQAQNPTYCYGGWSESTQMSEFQGTMVMLVMFYLYLPW